MKVYKKISCTALIGVLLFSNMYVSQASSVDFKEVAVDTWNVYTGKDVDIPKTTRVSHIENDGITLNNIINERIKSNERENIIFHNNGKPINTNLFLDKQGNELFAISLETENGQDRYTYHMADTNEIDMNDKISNIFKEEFATKNLTKGLTGDGLFIDNFKWDFYATINGTKQQQGSLSTSALMKRDSASSNSQSLWVVEESSQLLSRSNREIKDHKVRLDANQSTQILHDWGPKSQTNGDELSVSLSGLKDPSSWKFSIKGFSFVDLSRKASKYGRFQFVNKGIFASRELNVKPAITVSNQKGNLYIKMSQTVDFSKSSHQTGIIPLSEPDFN